MMRAHLQRVLWIFGALVLGACGSQTGYEKAFSEKSALSGNSREFLATSDQTFRTVKITLVQQGFTIEQVDLATGLIKAVRSLQDPNKPKYAYLITTTVDVTAQPSAKSSVVTVAASQQTILHKDSEKYFHLLGLVPIPTGRNYQTVVTKEGNIDKAGFYNDFFAAVNKNLLSAAMAAAATSSADSAPVTVSPLPPANAGVAPRDLPATEHAPPVVVEAAQPATANSSASFVPAPTSPSSTAPAIPTSAPSSRDPNELAPLDP